MVERGKSGRSRVGVKKPPRSTLASSRPSSAPPRASSAPASRLATKSKPGSKPGAAKKRRIDPGAGCPDCALVRKKCSRHGTDRLRRACRALCERHAPKKGFARLATETVRAMAARGGRVAQASGKAHRFSGAEAREAGRKGAAASRAAWLRVQRIAKMTPEEILRSKPGDLALDEAQTEDEERKGTGT